jgi:aryl-alcohol dehydrogenase-like predicted oxidoreductase
MGMSSFYGPARPEEEMVELIRYAVEQLGVTLLDTSDAYGPFTNEVLIGKVNSTCKTSSSANNYSSKSISSSDQHVILHSKIGRRKAKTCRFGSGK